jgi:hypothetical protein
MQKIYIARPGAQKEGPYTLEQINRDLASQKIIDTDFWAWHEGLPAWTPLYSVPGVSAKAWGLAGQEAQRCNSKLEAEIVTPPAKSAMAPACAVKLHGEALPPGTQRKPGPTAPPPESATSFVSSFQPETPETPEPVTPREAAKTGPAVQAQLQVSEPVSAPATGPESGKHEVVAAFAKEPAISTPEAEPMEPATFATPSMSSGKPFAALEQIFVFTTGEGPSVFKSEITAAMLTEAAGEPLQNIRANVPVDVMGGAAGRVLEAIRAGSIPKAAWRALFKIKASVAQQIQDGAYHLCIRTFPVESKELVALFLLYNKERL